MGGERRSEMRGKAASKELSRELLPWATGVQSHWGSLGDIHLRVNPPEGEGAGVFLYQLP